MATAKQELLFSVCEDVVASSTPNRYKVQFLQLEKTSIAR